MSSEYQCLAVELTSRGEDDCGDLSRVSKLWEGYFDDKREGVEEEEMGRVGESRSRKFSKLCSRTKERLQKCIQVAFRAGGQAEES